MKRPELGTWHEVRRIADKWKEGNKTEWYSYEAPQIGRKVLAIHSFDLEIYKEGTKVIILEGVEIDYLATRSDGTEITSRQQCYRIVDSSWIDYLYNTPHKVSGFGMVLVSSKQGYEAHLVLVNDSFEEVLVDRGDIPF